MFDYADGLVHDHWGQALPNATGVSSSPLKCKVFSNTTNALLTYAGKSHLRRRRQKALVGDVVDLYPSGPRRNIAAFYNAIVEGQSENGTVQRAVDGCLTCILGREAGLRRGRLTMDKLIKDNKRIELDLTGLKV